MRFFLSHPKTTLLVIIAGLLWFIFTQVDFGVPTYKKALHDYLLQTYRDNNRDYFGNKLTSHITIEVVDALRNDKGQDLYGSTYCLILADEKTQEDILVCNIKIDASYNRGDETAVMTLDHEMCHIKLWGTEFNLHDEAWQSCMKEGTAMGEFKDVWGT